MSEKKEIDKGERVETIKLSASPPPKMEQVGDSDWVDFGVNNGYPDQSISLTEGSATHNALINSKVDFMAGGGVEPAEEGGAMPPPPSKYDDWEGFCIKATVDYLIHGGFCFQVALNKVGDPVALYHVDFSKIRSAPKNKKFFYSDKWVTDKGKRNNNPQIKRRFKPWIKGSKHTHQLVYVKKYRAGQKEYPLPDYIGGVSAIATEKHIDNANLNYVKYGFLGGLLVTAFETDATRAKKEKIKKAIQQAMEGDDAERIFVEFANTKEDAMTIEPIAASANIQQFEGFASTLVDKIMVAHRVTNPMLFGVKTAGELGAKKEAKAAFDQFQKLVIEPSQRVIENAINDVLESMGQPKIKLKGMSPIVDDIPDEVINSPDLTRAERRALMSEKYGVELESEEEEQGEDEKFFSHIRENEIGVDASAYDIIEFRSLKMNEENSSPVFERFAAEEEELERNVLRNIFTNPYASITSVAEAIGVEIPIVARVVEKLLKIGFLIKTGVGYKATRKGRSNAKNIKDGRTIVETKYRYSLRPDAPPLKEGGKSRDWCSKMIAMNRLYTKQEILNLSNDLGTNVWLTRGGWYTPEGATVSLPYCRHEWQQVLVKKK